MPAHKPEITPAVRKEMERAAHLWRELESAPRGELLAVVQPFGVTGRKPPGERLWTVIISLMAWRLDGGPIQRRPLQARKRVSDAEFWSLQTRINMYSLLGMGVRLAEENVTGMPQALIVRYDGPAKNAELSRLAKELKKPKRIRDPELGMLVSDKSDGYLRGKLKWNRRQIPLELGPDRVGGFEPSIAHARAIQKNHSAWEKRVRKALIDEAYREWREVWRLDGERLLTAAQFLGRLGAPNFAVEADGSCSLGFDGDDLFEGHCVLVRCDLERGPYDVEIAG